jgi:hypothetical protein
MIGETVHYSDIREAQKQEEVSQDAKAFQWEKENIPLLHSGFTSPSEKDPAKAILGLSVYFDDGAYVARLQDRDAGERAFMEVGSLSKLFDQLELALKSGRLHFKKVTNYRGNGFGT